MTAETLRSRRLLVGALAGAAVLAMAAFLVGRATAGDSEGEAGTGTTTAVVVKVDVPPATAISAPGDPTLPALAPPATPPPPPPPPTVGGNTGGGTVGGSG